MSDQKRQRVAKACDTCRKRKARCDGLLPSCGYCAALNVPCLYTDASKKRTQPKSYVEDLEDRLVRAEKLLSGLMGNKHVENDVTQIESSNSLARSSLPRNLHPSFAPSFQTADSAGDATELMTLLKDNSAAYSAFGETSGTYILGHMPNFKPNASPNMRIEHTTSTKAACPQDSSSRHLPHASAYTIPSYETACELVDTYFSTVHSIFPLAVPRPTIEACIRKIYPNQMIEKSEKSCRESSDLERTVLLLNAVFTLACTYSGKLELVSQSEAYYGRARAILTSLWDSPALQTVGTIQSLLLLAMAEYSYLKLADAWLHVGHAIRLAQDLGLSAFQYENSIPVPDVQMWEWEEMRGAWWTCYVIDRLLSANYGRSVTIRDEDIPHQFDEIFHRKFDNDYEDWANMSTTMFNDPYVSGDTRARKATRRNILPNQFVYFITLAKILGQVSTHVNSRTWHLSIEERLKPIQEAMVVWLAKLPEYFRFDAVLRAWNKQDGESLTKAEELAKLPFAWYLQVWYHTTVILLHRPYITLPLPQSTPFGEVTRRASLGICTGSATAISNLLMAIPVSEFARAPCMFLFCMLTATTVHMNNLHFADESQQHKLQEESQNILPRQTVENGRIQSKALSTTARAGVGISFSVLDGLSKYFLTAGKFKALLQQEPTLGKEADNFAHLSINNFRTTSVNVNSQPHLAQSGSFPEHDSPVLFQKLM